MRTEQERTPSPIPPICPYCSKTSKLVDSEVIYGRSYGLVYICQPCQAWCGVHKGTIRPLGTLANAELREWRKRAHAAFDPIFKLNHLPRWKAYKRLAKALCLKVVHIGESDISTCKRIIEIVPQIFIELNLTEENRLCKKTKSKNESSKAITG